MGFKTTFNSTVGMKTESSDTNTVVFDGVSLAAPQKFSVTVADAGSNATVSSPVTLMRPSAAAGVTASLPAISSDTIGTMFSILKNAGTNPVLISGSNSITDGGAWTVAISTAGQTYKVMAISGTNGYYWHVV